VAHPVASRGAAVPRLARIARLGYAFGGALPGPAVACAAGLVAVQVLVLVAWGADTRAQAGAGAALRVGADLWLLAHGATLDLPSGGVRVLPLGLAALPVLVAASSGYRLAAAHLGGTRHPSQEEAAVAAGPKGSKSRENDRSSQARRPKSPGSLASRLGIRPRLRAPRRAALKPPASTGGNARSAAPDRLVQPHRVLLDIAAVVLAQTALVCVVCWAASSPAARPAPTSAVLGAAGLSCLGATVGVLAGYRRLGAAWRRMPVMLRVPLAGGFAATAALLAVSALGLCVLLIVRAGGVSSAASGLDPGVVGSVGLFAVQLVLLPNLVVWACCYALGTGFAAGPTVTVTPTTAAQSTLPDLPVLRLVPSAPLPGWAWLVLALAPLAAGTALALSVRRAIPGATLPGRLGMVFAGAAACALLVGLLAALSGGGIGVEAAAAFGPAPGWPILAAVVEVGMAGALVTSVAELLGRR